MLWSGLVDEQSGKGDEKKGYDVTTAPGCGMHGVEDLLGI